MTIEFHFASYSSASRVHWALEEIGVPYTKIKRDLKSGELKKPEYLALNPNAKVPLLVVDGRPLFESLAIILYLGDRFGVEKKLWPGQGDAAYLDALSWTVWGTTELGKALGNFAYATPDAKAGAVERVQEALGILEGRLGNRPYLLGEAFSLVDVANAAAVSWGRMIGVDLSAFPKIGAWVERSTSRPAQRAAMAAESQ